MKNLVRSFLSSYGIEYCSFLSMRDVRILNERKLPAGMKSAAIWLIPYFTGNHPDRNVSLYSVSKDYHIFAKELSGKLIDTLKDSYPDERFAAFCDSSPVDEVYTAAIAGLGVIGKNRLLINEKYGSYVFIAELLTSAELDFDDSEIPVAPGKCIGCGKCIRKCAFLAGEREFCLSELNQRKRLSESELEIVRAQKIRWGCDVCQEVCPMNENAAKTPVKFFYEDNIEKIDVKCIDAMPDREFSLRAYSWRKREVIRRNLADN